MPELTCGHDAQLYRTCSEEGQRTQHLCEACYPAFYAARAARHAREVAARGKPIKRSSNPRAIRVLRGDGAIALPGEPGQMRPKRRLAA